MAFEGQKKLSVYSRDLRRALGRHLSGLRGWEELSKEQRKELKVGRRHIELL